MTVDNYEIARDRAREYFLTKDLSMLLHRTGVRQEGEDILFPFLGCETRVSLKTGVVTCSDGEKCWEGDFSESLTVYDWLCDAKADAVPSGRFCPVNSLPGLFLGGSGNLMMQDKRLEKMADENPEGYRAACIFLGGTPCDAGDIGFKLNLFPDLPVVLKFYHSDEDFPAQLTVLWDENTLNFLRYETTYYAAGVLFRRLRNAITSYIKPLG